MNPLWLLFGFGGRIGRVAFLFGLALTVGLFAAAIHYSRDALPQMAEVLAPHGINAAFALNAIWLAASLLTLWALIGLTAKRLADRGHWRWWGAVAAVPAAGLLLINDAIFLLSRVIKLPGPAQNALVAACAIVAICVAVECLLMPGRNPDHR